MGRKALKQIGGVLLCGCFGVLYFTYGGRPFLLLGVLSLVWLLYDSLQDSL